MTRNVRPGSNHPPERIARLSKRAIDAADPANDRYVLWDTELKGFGLRVTPNGVKTFIVRYRAGGGRSGTLRQVTLGRYGALTPDQARRLALQTLGAVSSGSDPARELAAKRAAYTLAEVCRAFLEHHVEAKRKTSTAVNYRGILDRLVLPELGGKKAVEITPADIARLHSKLKAIPYQANRALAVIGSVYGFAGKTGLVPRGTNPAAGLDKYRERSRERFLTSDELGRLGETIREAETIGLPWQIDEGRSTAKHAPKPEKRWTKIDRHAAAALRLLLLTGCRLREILHLRWSEVDLGRGLLLLPDSKTGKKAIVLNGPALTLLSELPRIGTYVIAGASAGTQDEKPRPDLKKPWASVSKHAGLAGVRLHDLRHTHASIGAGAGLGLPIIGKLLGHTQPATTQRYAHLDNDPLRKASDRIGTEIAAAMGDHIIPPSDRDVP